MAESELMTITEIAELAGVKPRAVTEWVTKHKLRPREYMKRPGQRGGPVSMFSRPEVEVFLLERTAAKTALVPVSAPGPIAKNPEPVTVSHAGPRKATQGHALTRPPLPINQKLYLNIDEASEYTGLSKSYIRQNVPGRKIGPNGAMVYRRQHLEEMW